MMYFRSNLLVPILAVALLLVLSVRENSSAQELASPSEDTSVRFDSGYWNIPGRTGIVIASRFNYYDEQQYKNLLKHAETELHASFLTSVYVAWYGMNEQPVREWAEFAILDERPLSYQAIDSTYAGSMLIYRVAEQPLEGSDDSTASESVAPEQHVNSSTTCETPRFAERDILETTSCWHVRARLPYSDYDAHPAFIKAKQEALADLGQHLGLKVQQMERQGERLQSIVHQYAKYVFRDVHVSRLIIDEQELVVHVSVPKDRIIKL